MKFLPASDLASVDLAFGGDMEKLLPKRKDIPKEYWEHYDGKQDVFTRWFYKGLPEDTKFTPREGINSENTLKHIRAIMASWEPKHEHKTAGCSYLIDLWFEKVKIPEDEKS